MATITVYKTTYAAWEEGQDEPERIAEERSVYEIEDFRDQYGEWNEDETEWVPSTVTNAAFNLLTGSNGHFWASECSSSSAEVACGDNPFYIEEPYTNPYTAEFEEKTAHLKGFTPEEIAQIHKLVRGR